MEPFDLTFHQVKPEESLSESTSFDSFSNVVNYETSFDLADHSLPLSTYNVNTLHYTWKDFTYPTTTAIQTANGGVPTGHSSTAIHHQSIWYSGTEGSPPHQSYLVHPDDSLADSRVHCEQTPSVSKQQLKILAQISANTSAAKKEGKRSQKLIARTITSPSTPIPATPITMTEPSHSHPNTFPLNTSSSSDKLESDSGSEDIKDSSFETVAEALKLQWSVIGNKTLTPVSPDIVAQIVAQAEHKIKSGELNPPSLLPSAPSLGLQLQEAPSQQTQSLMTPVVLSPNQEIHKTADSQRELTRIIPTEITTEKVQGGLWYSGTKAAEPLVHESNGHPSLRDQKSTVPAMSLSPRQPDHKHLYHIDATDNVPESVDVDVDKYIQSTLLAAGITTDYKLESEEFLRSLPPIKPISLDAFVNIPLLPAKTAKTPDRKQTLESLSSKNKPNDSAVQQNHLSDKSSLPFISPASSLSSDRHDSSKGSLTPAMYSEPTAHNFNHNSSSPLHDSSTLYRSPLSAADSPGLNVSKKGYDDLLKEKAKLQGQLEVLADESQAMLKERAELQAQLATLKGKLAQLTASGAATGADAQVRKELENLRISRQLLESTLLDANRMLSEKAEEIRALQDELQVAQEALSKIQVRSQDMRDEIRAKDMNIQALKNKIAELYVEVQMTIQAKMEADTEARTSRNDLVSLVKAKEWYQEQLQLAHDVRSKLQRELTILQGQTVSHGTIVERLKSESTRLRQQLLDTQQRALKDKEILARHLEVIQSDMTEREAAFLEIQRERKLFEDTFNYQVVTAEEEKSRLALLQQATHDLEAQLDRAHTEAKKRHEQLLTMEQGQMGVMKRLAVAEKTLGEKESALEDAEHKLIQRESQLQAVMSDLTKKDNEILTLKEEKASTEIALKSALQEKSSVDKALDVLKADMGKVELSFKQMKQELNVRLSELQHVMTEKEKLQEELDRSLHELEIKSLSVDAMTRTFDGQSAARHDLQAAKNSLEDELHGQKLKIQDLQYQLNQKEAILAAEIEKVTALDAKVCELEAKLESSKQSVPMETIKIYESEMEELRLRIRALEETEVEEANEVEREKKQLQTEITKLREELLERQKVYSDNMEIMDRKFKELMADKQQLEIELGIARRSEELSQLEERDSYTEEIQGLTKELRLERTEKEELVEKLKSVQASREAEVETLQLKLLHQTEALQALQAWQATVTDIEAMNQRLELELEKERGRVMGLSQKNAELKEHSHELEAALAQRESAFDDLKRSVEESAQGLEQRDRKFMDRISALEVSVEKEVEVQRDLRKQMGSKIMENKRLKKQTESIKVELEHMRQDLANSQQLAHQALADLEAAHHLSQNHLAEARECTAQIKLLEVELERSRRDLSDNLARQPLLMEQIQSLEWQCSQKCREVESAQEQMRIVEERAQAEVEAMKTSLQAKQSEIDHLQAELTALRQDKSHQRSQVTELRGALKASVQHHKLTKRLNEADTNDKSVQANIERKIVIPPLPFDLAMVEQLIQDTKVTPLDSRPLDQLSSCLSSLRAEITGLQKQMDRHTTAVHISNQSWRSVQSEVNDLNEVMRTIANTIIAANSTSTGLQMSTAMDRETADILHI